MAPTRGEGVLTFSSGQTVVTGGAAAAATAAASERGSAQELKAAEKRRRAQQKRDQENPHITVGDQSIAAEHARKRGVSTRHVFARAANSFRQPAADAPSYVESM